MKRRFRSVTINSGVFRVWGEKLDFAEVSSVMKNPVSLDKERSAGQDLMNLSQKNESARLLSDAFFRRT